ncbi:Response regulator of zinc sigma-54-dependent two-component system [Olavius algarvensis spirochete endosymbiont]|uniref:sigma-54 interaction domain-containing protein n=1 Tax=Olavius algarvensis spirochete endosymbiont TaxID=260710 RepID=UPI000F10120B|nr:sigma-54 dependent transcriptional regulator [Olavius algarvensis spirochete endosymbiont]VDB00325.1 Response regulator of zinc sigma-54-dependent two-component system [Olavius algarvensis spirochete endosymbiont]
MKFYSLRSLAIASLAAEKMDLSEKLISTQKQEYKMVWKSEIIKKVLDQAEKIASSDFPVLISGESGTGKELLARRIYRKSKRSNNQFVSVNCAAIPDHLIESELFGHAKGSFTDAIRDRTGYFERANLGTLFLDEVTELTLSAQGKLLRILQDGRFQRVGDEIELESDVRVIAATNRKLEDCVRLGKFRQDLYYRLAVLQIALPPLRGRLDDITVLAEHFLKKHSTNNDDAPTSLSTEAMSALLLYRWPGNIRELQNSLERAVIMGKGKEKITLNELALPNKESNAVEYVERNLKSAMKLFKRNFIREVLEEHDGNRTIAANTLGIQRTYLSRIIKELNIDI